jgi:hypothetical protein
MNNFGVQCINKPLGTSFREESTLQKLSKESLEIRETLRQFQQGYIERDIEKVDTFVEELFIAGDDTSVLGTGTGELFLGTEKIKTLIKNDWIHWGNVNIDLQNVHIDNENEVAWFAAPGTVKFTFEDTQERYDNYVSFIKNKAEEPELTAKQKIAFINWVLSLAYHQRIDKKREYFWPLLLSGVLLKDKGKWKFAHIQFSIPKANFPDERFENSKEHFESYNSQNAIVDTYLKNQMTTEIKTMLKGLETELVGQENISQELISKYFGKDNTSYIIGPDNQWCIGLDQIRDFFNMNNNSILSLDFKHSIASKSGRATWVILSGTLKQRLTEDELAVRVLEDLGRLFQSNLSSKEKLFAAHRSTAYVLKESASGEDFTCPIRLTALILNQADKPVIQNIHFSFPFYWIFEEKL